MMNPTPLLEAHVPVAGHEFTALIDGVTGELLAGGFCATAELFARLEPNDRGERSPAPSTHPVVQAIRAYADGAIEAIDGVPVRQTAPPFRRDIQAALRRIPAGTVLNYAELAAEAGRPTAVRAAGSGCATNLVALVIPCHRVVRTGGSLGGYAYGLAVKEALLRHEGAR